MSHCVLQGRIPMKILQVHSTFHDQMVFKSVTFQPADQRWYFVNAKEENVSGNGNNLLILEPQTNNTVSTSTPSGILGKYPYVLHTFFESSLKFRYLIVLRFTESANSQTFSNL